MKHIKPFNENVDNLVEEVSYFCETNLAYLVDEGMRLFVQKHVYPQVSHNGGFIEISINFSTENNVFWNDIKDHIIPFLTRLKSNYKILDIGTNNQVSFRMCEVKPSAYRGLLVSTECLTIDEVIKMDEIIQTQDNHFLLNKKITRIWVAVKI